MSQTALTDTECTIASYGAFKRPLDMKLNRAATIRDIQRQCKSGELNARKTSTGRWKIINMGIHTKPPITAPSTSNPIFQNIGKAAGRYCA